MGLSLLLEFDLVFKFRSDQTELHGLCVKPGAESADSSDGSKDQAIPKTSAI